MNAFLDAVGAWFQSFGVHPVLGAFILGAVIAFAFAYRRSAAPESADGAGLANRAAVRPRGMVESTTVKVENTNISMTVNGKDMQMPSEVIAQLRAGNKIEAIKALRHASGLDLKEAKDVVEMIEKSPLLRTGRAG